MKLIFIFILLNSLIGKAQNLTKFDSLIKDVLIKKELNKQILNPEISEVLKILDNELINYDFVNQHKFNKYIILSSFEYYKSTCSETKEFIKLTHSSNKKIGQSNTTYSELWDKSKGDSIIYIKEVKNYLPKDFFKLNKHQRSLENYAKNIDLKHIIFFDYRINDRIKKALKKNKKNKKEILNTFKNDLGYYFDIKKRKIVFQHIYITDIVFDCNQYVYVEMDAFDVHYLFTIDKLKKTIIKNEELWVY